MPATVSAAVTGLSYNNGSDSSLSLKGSGFQKGTTTVTVTYPINNPVYSWDQTVHKVSADGKKCEVKLKQKTFLTEEQLRQLTDTTDVVLIVVDSSSTITATAELYSE